MASQSDRYSDGYEIANASQNVASNSASDRGQRTEVSDRGQNVLLYSPQHHVVQVGNASSVAPSPVTTPDAMMSLTAIEHLDFEPERECEHPQHPLGEMGHSGPAWALVEVIHLCASPSRTLVYVCRGGWDEAGARGTHCQRCGENLTRDQSWRIVQVLR